MIFCFLPKRIKKIPIIETIIETAPKINGNKIINYDNDKIDLKRLNEYLKDYKGFEMGNIPNNLYEFTTIGYFCDETDIVYELYTDELNYGRRKLELMS